MRLRLFGSIRQRFLAVVLCGAVLPLALAGWWLSRSSVRSAESLLRGQLDTSLTTITANMDRRWDYRRGDLLMLAGNAAAVRAVAASGALDASDSAYLARLYSGVSSTIPRVTYRAANGAILWHLSDSLTRPAPARGATRGPSPIALRDARMTVTFPVLGQSGAPAGSLDAEVRLSAILPADSIPILLKDAQLTVADQRSRRAFTADGLGDAPIDAAEYSVSGARWIALHRPVAGGLLVVTASAPTAPYVGPFEHAARIGMAWLGVVMMLSLALTAYFTGRITRSLERLASAAGDVAGGNLERNVEATGNDEVARLGQSFNVMIDSLRRTLRELSHREALAAVGEFATSLSHEVRNGLTAVRVDLERAEESGPSAPESRMLVSRSLRNVLRLNGTVTGALAVARSGRTALDAVELGVVLQASATAAQHAFDATEASLLLACASPCTVRGDAVALEQLFLNLLLNAAEAMSAGGRARLELDSSGDGCTVSVLDDGPGMSAERLDRVHEPYVSSKRGGTGLGISIARKIVEAHHGTLTFDNVPGGGLRVTVRLPRITP